MKNVIGISDDELLARLPEAAAGADEAFRIQAAAASRDEVDVEIYDVLFPWEPKRLLGELKGVKAKTINLRINSPGGEVFGGVAIYNALVRHPARVVVHVDGVAASIASVIAMAGDEIHMGLGTHMMIHDPHTVTMGSAKKIRETADLLDMVATSIADIYSERTGKSQREVLALMAKTTWFTAEQAVTAGFANSTSDKPAVKNEFHNEFLNYPPAQLVACGGAAPGRKIETKREFEAFLRDEGGLSHAAARVFAASFKGDPEPRDEDGDSLIAVIEAKLAETQLIATLVR